MPVVNALVGNPKPGSRTLTVARSLAERIADASGLERGSTIDLADHLGDIFQWPSNRMDAIADTVKNSRIVVIATPTYKASYTGLLKAFLDRYPHNALAGVTAVPVMTVSSPEHSLAVDFALRPLLVELGACLPTRGLAFCMPEMNRMNDVLSSWLEVNLPALGVPALTGAARR